MQQPDTRLLQRDAISSVLASALSHYPLVVLTAPMGYGKTTAARALAHVMPRNVFYITLPSGSHNAYYLWDRACEQAIAKESKMAVELQRMEFPANAIQAQRTVDTMREHLAGGSSLLILDDYHFVDSPELDGFMEALTREQIPGFNILLLSRTRPRLPLEEFRVKGLAALFGQDLLTFSPADAVRYFAMNGVTDEEAANKAWLHCEGWAAALWLSLHSFLSSGALNPVRDMEKLISGTVFSRYGDDDKKLLMQLAVLESFTPRQAAAITGNQGAPRRLRIMQDQNAFMVYDAITDSYRLHSIFRTFLERILAERNEEAANSIDIAELYRRAGEWYAVEGDMLQAVRFLFKAGTEEGHLRILQLFEQPSDGLLVMFDPEGFYRNMQAISWEVRCRCPIGYLAFIYHYMSRVSHEQGTKLLMEAEHRFARTRGIPAALRRRIRGEIELIYGIVDFNDLSAMRDRHEAAHTLLDGRSSISHNQLIWTFGSPHLAFLYLRDPGSYETLVELVRNNLFYYQEMTNGCSTGAQDLFYAELLLERGQCKKAEPHIMKAAYRAGVKEQLSTLIASHFTEARLCLASGKDVHQILEGLRDLAPQVTRTGNPLMANSLDLSIGYIAAAREIHESIPAWLCRGDLAAAPNFYQGAGFVRIVHGKALAASSDWAALEALAQDIPGYLGKYRNLMGIIHAHIMRAIAAMNLYGGREAKPYIQKALELARHDCIALTFAEYGRHLPPLLDLLDAHPDTDNFVALIRRLNQVYSRPPQQTGLLARREAEILNLAVAGKNNNEIAEALGLKPVTVGNTLSRAYKKLGVANRTEAALVWRRKRPSGK